MKGDIMENSFEKIKQFCREIKGEYSEDPFHNECKVFNVVLKGRTAGNRIDLKQKGFDFAFEL